MPKIIGPTHLCVDGSTMSSPSERLRVQNPHMPPLLPADQSATAGLLTMSDDYFVKLLCPS